MNKLVAITYAVLILMQSLNFSFEDASRLNALFEHAQYHQETFGDSFLDFLQSIMAMISFNMRTSTMVMKNCLLNITKPALIIA